ncbi:TPA: hypothetical protein MFH03_005399 [Klebsiella pneumoniae]|uniref:hypothetical protein n=1 Tax=Klebsiella pneumoniae complex TaxID=3390273 RepID=UPI000765AFB4|nr:MULTISPECIES: hypothetical protein [Klebsiella]NWO50136.1 hypothetical protein [Klebsiella pneumoniae]HBW7834836.1 hypothetical protein [Klebsiella pneumoniae]
MTQMLIPALIWAITVVYVLHSVLKDIHTAFWQDWSVLSTRYPALFIKPRSTRDDKCQELEVVRPGDVYCVRYGERPEEKYASLTSYGHSPETIAGKRSR